MQKRMKKSMILVMAAAAAALALVSCTKETTDSNESGNANEGLRTLTVGFADPNTRTAPTTIEGGIQPVWASGDQITISNGSSMENVTVPPEAVGQSSFTVTTSLTGTLTVYYPGGEKYDKYWSGDNAIVPASQTGNFADANICKGSVDENGTNLTLNNQTAVFEVSVPSGTKQLTVTSLNPVSSSTGRRATSGAVNIAEGSATITVGNNTADIPNPCYVSVLAPATGAVLLQDLNFDTGSAQGGFSPKYITSKGKTPSSYAVEVNTMYTLAATSLHEYVELTMTVNSVTKTYKWATMNVGATSSTDYGYYFAWGETDGHIGDTSTKKFENDYSFSWANAPFNNDQSSYDGTYFGTVKNTVCPNEVLALAYDAAFCNWGGAWRMPTKGEFNSFILGAPYAEGNFEYNGVTFPAAGAGITKLQGAGSGGYYWSSSLSTVSSQDAYHLSFAYGPAGVGTRSRYYGESVRPLSE